MGSFKPQFFKKLHLSHFPSKPLNRTVLKSLISLRSFIIYGHQLRVCCILLNLTQGTRKITVQNRNSDFAYYISCPIILRNAYWLCESHPTHTKIDGKKKSFALSPFLQTLRASNFRAVCCRCNILSAIKITVSGRNEYECNTASKSQDQSIFSPKPV